MQCPLIQITHIHPEDAHAIRHDFDREELVADDYPVILAHKMIPFLVSDDQWKWAQGQNSEQDDIKQSIKEEEDLSDDDVPLSQVSRAESVVSSSAAQQTTTNGAARARSRSNASLLETPQRMSTPPASAAFTARSLTPKGIPFSPLKDQETTPSRRGVARRRGQMSVPRGSSLVAPEIPPTPRGRGHGGRGRGRGRAAGLISARERDPLPLVEFNHKIKRHVNHSHAKPTLILRHDANAEALKDLFAWGLRCVQCGSIVSFDGWLMKFHDRSRVQEIKNLCVLFKLNTLRSACDKVLRRWDFFVKDQATDEDADVPSIADTEEHGSVRSLDLLMSQDDGSTPSIAGSLRSPSPMATPSRDERKLVGFSQSVEILEI